MKIVVDTNIVFSGILNSTSKIGRLLLTSKKYFDFYSCDYLRFELLKHRSKLLKYTNLPEQELIELQNLVCLNITFINEALIPEDIFVEAKKLVMDIDPNDTPFITLTKHLHAKFWTGDKFLTEALKVKRFKNIINTSELLNMLDELEGQ